MEDKINFDDTLWAKEALKELEKELLEGTSDMKPKGLLNTTLNPREEKLLDEFMRGGLHQLTNEEALAVQTKRFKDGEIILPNTFYTEDCSFYPRGDTYKIDLGKNDDTQMTTIKISRDFDLSNLEKEGITETVLSDEMMKRLNELCIKDTKEMYVRELMNRIHKAMHRIQLLQMDGEVTVKDLGLIVRDLRGE